MKPIFSILSLLAGLILGSEFIMAADLQWSENPVREGTPYADLSTLQRVLIKKIRIDGNTVFTASELSSLTSRYEGRELDNDDLESLRRELTALYVEKGFVNSGAIIPDQKVGRDGVLNVLVVEGRLADVVVSGNRYFRTSYLRKRLIPDEGAVNVYDLQQKLLILQQDARIRNIRAEFRPGFRPGEAVLEVKVEEKNPFRLGVEVNNQVSPAIASGQGRLNFAHRNLTGNGDIFSGYLGLYFTGNKDPQNYELSYQLPLTAKDATIQLYYRNSESVVIEEPFEGLDIKSLVNTLGLTLRQPVYRLNGHDLALGLTGEYRRSKTYLLGEGYSYEINADDGRTTEFPLRFFQEYSYRTQNQVVAARSTLSLGLNAFGATKGNKEFANARFADWLGQFQWLRRIPELWDTDVFFRADVQLSADPLLSMEKFPVGGMYSVRGYRENRFTRDNGYSASFELRYPLVKDDEKDVLIQLVGFYDFGESWNTGETVPDPQSINSLGLGVKGGYADKFSFELYWGAPLRKIAHGDTIQDQGFHFRICAYLF